MQKHLVPICKTKKEVLRAFKKSSKYDIPLCLRSGAHCYEAYSLCEGMVLDQSRRTKVIINKKKRLLTIESGCLNGPTAAIVSKYGLMLPAGTRANVGIVGLCLGGGLSFGLRMFGFDLG